MVTSPPDHPHALATGTRLLWYEIRAVLGQGGFGITYLAQDNNLDQPVAIKEFLPAGIAVRQGLEQIVPATPESTADFRWGLRRFVEEGRTVARFDHPAIVRVQSVFEANGTAYLVMRYERGESLAALLRRVARVPERHLIRILRDLMSGLEVMHAAGFIHRDIKPGNIYLRDDGRALLIDFGAARQALSSQTRALTSVVSPGYAPFEQYRADGIAQGPWTDIYALGATAYRAISGRAPQPALERSHRFIEGESDCHLPLDPADNEHYSQSLLQAINRALAFRPADRPQSIAQWRACFDASWISFDEPAETPSVPTPGVATVPAGNPAAVPRFEEITTVVADPSRAKVGARSWLNAVAGFAVALGLAAAVALRQPPPASPDAAAASAAGDAASEQVSALPAPAVLAPPAEAGTVLSPATPAAAGAPLPSETPIATGAPPPSEALIVAEAPLPSEAVITPAEPLPAPGTVDEVARLLAAATDDLAAWRLTTPPGENAWDRYRRVLALEPANAAAQQGLDAIVGRYLTLAADAAAGNDFEAAEEYIALAAAVRPADERVAQAQRELARRVAAAGQAATPDVPAASAAARAP